MTRQISPPFDSVVQTSGYLLQTRPRRTALRFAAETRCATFSHKNSIRCPRLPMAGHSYSDGKFMV